MTNFSCNKKDLLFDPLSVVRFGYFLAFWKANDIRKRIAQVLQGRFCTILVFLSYISDYLKFCKFFCIFEMAWSRDFQKCIFYHFLTFFQTFLLFNWILLKNFIFSKFAFFSDSQSRPSELFNDVSFHI